MFTFPQAGGLRTPQQSSSYFGEGVHYPLALHPRGSLAISFSVNIFVDSHRLDMTSGERPAMTIDLVCVC